MRTDTTAIAPVNLAPASPAAAAVPAPGQPEVYQLAFDKTTAKSVRFKEVAPPGQAPVFDGGVYLPDWKAGKAQGIALVLLPGANSPAPDNADHVATLVRGKETSAKVVFNEQPQPGKPPVFGNVYIPKWKAGAAQSITLALVLG